MGAIFLMTTKPKSASATKTIPPPEAEQDFHLDQVLTISGGHLTHDMFSGFIPALLPLIQEQLAISYALTGSLAVYARLPSLLNPFLGYIADKVSVRYFVILAPAITATLINCIGLTSTYFSLVLLLLAIGVSIAAFHAPAPAMIGRVSGSKVGTGMSIFMAGGEMGRMLGPLLAVAGVEWFGIGGMWRLSIIGWLVSAILYYRFRDIAAQPRSKLPVSFGELLPQIRVVFLPLAGILFTRSFLLISLSTFLPIFMSDVLESSLWLAAASLTILEGGGFVGALLSGTLSDRFGRPQVLLFLFSTAPFLFFLFLYGPSILAIPVLIALGLTAISPTPVLLALVQDQFKENRALTNGLFMTINFLTYALAVSAVGVWADQFGLFQAFLFSGVIALFAIPVVSMLPKSA